MQFSSPLPNAVPRLSTLQSTDRDSWRLHLARHGEYADLVARLLKPGGIFIDQAFPLDAHEGGPPFAVSRSELFAHFGVRRFSLLRRETPPDSVPQRRGLEELFVFQKVGGAAN